MNKKSLLLTSIISLGLFASTICLSACNSSGQEEIVVNKTNISLSKKSADLCVGDSFLLSANISGGTHDTKLVFVSNNPNVVSVSEFGFVNALKPGRAEIKATYGTSADKCIVNVGFGDNSPIIQISNIFEKSIKVDLSSRITIKPVISFNLNEYSFEPQYYLSNDIGKMEGDLFVPNKNGVTYLTISGFFNGIKAVPTTIEIIVEDNIIVYMKDDLGIETNTIYVYSHPGFGGETFKTSFKATFGVIINDKEIDNPKLTIDLENDDNVVTFDSTTNTINSTNKPGMARFIVTYDNDETYSFIKTFDIYNNKSVFNYNAPTIEGDSVATKLPTNEIFKDFPSKEIEKVTSLDGETEYEIKDQKIIGLPILLNKDNELTSYKIVVYNNTVGFIVDLKVYSKIVSEAKDFEYFTMTSDLSKFDGYYIVSNDIDGNGYKLPAHLRTMGKGYGEWNGSGLLGTFDGRGHTIKNISVGEGGLFGNLGKGAQILNVSFRDFIIRRESGKDDTPLIASYTNGATFSNVHIYNSYIDGNYNCGLLCCNLMSSCSLNNCLFECPMESGSSITTQNYGIFGSMFGERSSLPNGTNLTFNNVVVKSYLPLVRSCTNQPEPYFVDAPDFVYEEIGFRRYDFGGDIVHYKNNADMKQSGNQFSGFTDEYWTINDGILMWKAK